MSDLKPCPFCGKKPETEIIHLSSVFLHLGEFDPREPIVNVGCSHCGIAISYRPDFWNTRPAEDALNKELTEQAANYENIICEYKRDVKQAVEQIDTLTAEVERLKGELADRDIEGYAGFMLGIGQMERKLAEKEKEIERLKADNQVYRDMLNSLLNEEVYHLDNVTMTNIKYELDNRGKDTNVPANDTDTNVGKMEG